MKGTIKFGHTIENTLTKTQSIQREQTVDALFKRDNLTPKPKQERGEADKAYHARCKQVRQHNAGINAERVGPIDTRPTTSEKMFRDAQFKNDHREYDHELMQRNRYTRTQPK